MNVFILATCRKPELIDATLLVFKTLRVGFPSARVHVQKNGDFPDKDSTVSFWNGVNDHQCCPEVIPDTIHHDWIRNLIASESEPFFICDTDIVFFNSVEEWQSEGPIAGEFVPAFFEKFTGCLIQSRLHTALLYIDPVKVRKCVETWNALVPETQFTPRINLVNPVVMPVPFGPIPMFFDTCSLLYHAIGGQKFTEDQLSAFEHLNCGTWVDMIEHVYPGMRKVHQEIYEDPRRSFGLRKIQRKFYDECAAQS